MIGWKQFWREIMHEFGVCSPTAMWTEGADHTGIDAYLRCTVCRRRTMTHVECFAVTPEIRAVLKPEWRKGNIERENEAYHAAWEKVFASMRRAK